MGNSDTGSLTLAIDAKNETATPKLGTIRDSMDRIKDSTKHAGHEADNLSHKLQHIGTHLGRDLLREAGLSTAGRLLSLGGLGLLAGGFYELGNKIYDNYVEKLESARKLYDETLKSVTKSTQESSAQSGITLGRSDQIVKQFHINASAEEFSKTVGKIGGVGKTNAELAEDFLAIKEANPTADSSQLVREMNALGAPVSGKNIRGLNEWNQNSPEKVAEYVQRHQRGLLSMVHNGRNPLGILQRISQDIGTNINGRVSNIGNMSIEESNAAAKLLDNVPFTENQKLLRMQTSSDELIEGQKRSHIDRETTVKEQFRNLALRMNPKLSDTENFQKSYDKIKNEKFDEFYAHFLEIDRGHSGVGSLFGELGQSVQGGPKFNPLGILNDWVHGRNTRDNAVFGNSLDEAKTRFGLVEATNNLRKAFESKQSSFHVDIHAEGK